MWRCPDCGRTFEHTNQHHFCEPLAEIDEYIAQQSEEVRPLLNKLRDVIRAAAPDAKERISWQMPTFWQRENLCHFAANKKHIGLYPGGEAVGVFADRLTDYKTSKGAIQFPLKRGEDGAYQDLDYSLVTDIVKWRVGQVSMPGHEPVSCITVGKSGGRKA